MDRLYQFDQYWRLFFRRLQYDRWVISVYASFLVGHRLATEFKQSAVPRHRFTVCLFDDDANGYLRETTTLDMSKLGAQGLFTAMICGLVFARLYCFILEKISP